MTLWATSLQQDAASVIHDHGLPLVYSRRVELGSTDQYGQVIVQFSSFVITMWVEPEGQQVANMMETGARGRAALTATISALDINFFPASLDRITYNNHQYEIRWAYPRQVEGILVFYKVQALEVTPS